MKAVILQQIVRAWQESNVMTLVYDFGVAPVDGVTALTGSIPLKSQHRPAGIAKLPNATN